MSEIPNVPLSRVVMRTSGGGTPERDNPDLWNGGIPWASVKDFKDGLYRLSTTKEQISAKGLKRSASHLIPAGTPIICTRMAVGRIARADVPVAINQDLRALFISDDFDTDYVVWAVDAIRHQIEKLAIGSTVKGISIDQLLSFEIGAPPKPEQTKIAEILSTVDRAIEQTEALIAKQQRLKTGLMQDLLTRGIDEHGKLRSEQTHQFKDSPLGRIPVEWDVVPIGEMALLQRGHDITESVLVHGPYPVVSSGGVVGWHNEFTSNGPNVVVGRKGTIGKIHYLESEFWAHDTSLYVTNFFNNIPRFVFHLFVHLDLSRFGTKSGSPSLNRNDVHPIRIGLPDPKEQHRIARMLDSFSSSVFSNSKNLAKLKTLKTALMQDLLTGRKRVTTLLEGKEASA